MVDTRISNLSKTLTLIDLAFLDNKGNYPICRLVGSEVIINISEFILKFFVFFDLQRT
uniref:Uncharacterized protein n=1 Tax=Colwellia sp. C1 TaxID=1737566 RepID=A0A168PI40_9GAMM|nr:hypothetical protein [Colwellia sp. C1]